MDKNEFSRLAAAMRKYYPRETILPNAEAMSLWYDALQDLPYQTAIGALRRWVSLYRWSPSIADIRQMAVEQTAGAPADWSEGWRQVCEAIDSYGRTDPAGALASMDPVTRETVERLGWSALCGSENQAADRAAFRQIYESIARRAAERQRLPESAVAEIAGNITKRLNG